MSRIGKIPVAIPSGVEVKVDGHVVTVKGSKGELTREFNPMMTIKVEGEEVIVERPDDSRQAKSLHGLTRTLIHNMVEGVHDGYSKKLELVGVGYRAALKGSDLEIQLGYSHPVIVKAPENITFEVPSQTEIIVKGISKEQVARLLPTSAHGVSLSLTRARVFAMKASMSVVSSARPQSLSSSSVAKY